MSNTSRFLLSACLAFGFSALSFISAFAQNGSLAVATSVERPADKRVTIKLNTTARYPGCEYDAYSADEKNQCSQEMMKLYIQQNLEYPEIAKSPDFKPRIVRVEITVEPDGRTHSPRVLEPGIREYDAQAQMVFVKMTQEGIRWTPGVYEGNPVKSPFVATVHFNWEGRNKAFPEMAYADDIFEYVDEPAAFRTCQVAGRKDKEVRACVQERMADFFERNMQYPADALEVGLEGAVDVEFVVGKNGQLKDLRLKNDIGLGCGEEALRLVELMNKKETLEWVPGEEDGQQVNVLEKTTVHFRIAPSKRPAEKLAQIDARKVFITERKGFEDFLVTMLAFPKGESINPCAQGVIDVWFKVAPVTDEIIVQEMIDYNNLGKEFLSAASDFLRETTGEWTNTYPNLSTETVYKLTIPFVSNSPTCPMSTDEYRQTVYRSLDAASLMANNDTQREGLASLDDAVRTYPADNKMRHLRGMALYDSNRKVEACVDLSFVSKQNKNIPVPKTCK